MTLAEIMALCTPAVNFSRDPMGWVADRLAALDKVKDALGVEMRKPEPNQAFHLLGIMDGLTSIMRDRVQSTLDK